ncbi:hypothetical protein Tco_1056694 [Tanacetum coccineum]|uniref:Tf2-1-like SH3-like domain-containing protein n=1 Tax=Tanacetum coccineum TaxID=301880 RepID=A0ABQ5H399_9ASTR
MCLLKILQRIASDLESKFVLVFMEAAKHQLLMDMDWLSKRKFVIVCHEKVVRIPLEGDETLQVHGERTQEVVKTLMNTKVEFRIDLVHGATSVAKSPYRLAPLEMQELSEQLRELQDKKEEHGVHLKLELELLRKEKLYAKSSVKDKILATSSETSKVENTPAEMLRDLDQQMEKRADDDAAKSVRNTIGFEYYLASSSGCTNYHSSIWCAPFEALYGRKCRSPVLWDKIGESSLIRPELVQEMTNKVVLIKEKLKVVRDRQKSCADNRRKPLEFEVGERVMLKVSPWKGVIRFGKKGKLAPRYVGPFEILERIGLVAYLLRFPEELNRGSLGVVVEVRFLTSFLDDGRGSGSWMFLFVGAVMLLCVPFCGQAKLSAVRYLVKVRWNSKRGPEFTWERKDYVKSKYPQLFVDRADESAS